MTLAPPGAGGGGGARRCSRPRCVLVPAVCAALLVPVLSGCSASSASDADPTAGAGHAGSYPVATPGAAVHATPEAADGHYQLVSAGDTVRATLGPAVLLAKVTGPELTVPPGPPADAAPGVLTVDLTGQAGSTTVTAASFLVLDEARHAVPVRADAASVAVSGGRHAVLRLSGRLPAGHATVTWQPTGRPVVTWDFVVEID